MARGAGVLALAVATLFWGDWSGLDFGNGCSCLAFQVPKLVFLSHRGSPYRTVPACRLSVVQAPITFVKGSLWHNNSTANARADKRKHRHLYNRAYAMFMLRAIGAAKGD